MRLIVEYGRQGLKSFENFLSEIDCYSRWNSFRILVYKMSALCHSSFLHLNYYLYSLVGTRHTAKIVQQISLLLLLQWDFMNI